MDFIFQVLFILDKNIVFSLIFSSLLGPNDGVTCFYCGNTLVDWSTAIVSTNENIVQLEHARFFPCRFVTYTAGGKFVANAGYFHTVSAQGRIEKKTKFKRILSNNFLFRTSRS